MVIITVTGVRTFVVANVTIMRHVSYSRSMSIGLKIYSHPRVRHPFDRSMKRRLLWAWVVPSHLDVLSEIDFLGPATSR